MSSRPKTRADRRRAARKRAGGRPLPVFGIVVAVMIVLAVVAILLSSRSGRQEAAHERAPVTIDGESLPVLPSGGDDPAAGATAPAVSGVTFGGEEMSITPGNGPTAVIFLAHWCPHCQVEVTRVQQWLDANGPPAGVDLVAVSTLADAARPNWPPSVWLEEEGWEIPTLVDSEDSEAAEAYGLSGTPFWVFLDGDGKVVQRVSGEVEIPVLEQILSALATS